MLSIIVPRPIGLISTISLDGVPNLAPFSYFQAVSSVPPAILFCPNRNRLGKVKHSLQNTRSQGEFVACAVTEDMAEKINYASGEFPDGVNEFEAADFTPLASELVKPFRVEESPVSMECKVMQVIELSDQPLGGSIVIGEVVRFHLNESMFDRQKCAMSLDSYRPISRLGGVAFCLQRETFDMPRPRMTPDGQHIVQGSHKITRGPSD
jgi:flavin reductase (DIM6/NTAB) family NADH-FMN oxidoreductase RutF